MSIRRLMNSTERKKESSRALGRLLMAKQSFNNGKNSSRARIRTSRSNRNKKWPEKCTSACRVTPARTKQFPSNISFSKARTLIPKSFDSIGTNQVDINFKTIFSFSYLICRETTKQKRKNNTGKLNTTKPFFSSGQQNNNKTFIKPKWKYSASVYGLGLCLYVCGGDLRPRPLATHTVCHPRLCKTPSSLTMPLSYSGNNS